MRVVGDNNEEDKGEEDCLAQGGHSETGSIVDAGRNERFVIFNEELAGGLARVRTIRLLLESRKSNILYSYVMRLCINKCDFVMHVVYIVYNILKQELIIEMRNPNVT